MGTEVDVPEPVVNFGESDELPAEDDGDVDPVVGPTDATVGGDLPDLEDRGVIEGGELMRDTPRRRHVELVRHALCEGFVGPLGVELGSEGVEATLLSEAVLLGWQRGVTLEGAMHAFVTTVLLGLAGFDELWGDAESDPPDRESREAAERVGGEGRAVVRADALRQSVLPEDPLEHCLRGI